MLVHFMNIFELLESERIITNTAVCGRRFVRPAPWEWVRVSRYVGQRKRHLQAVFFIGCAVNLQRVARWQAGIHPQTRKAGWALAPVN